jgi:hypothetical protein
MVSAVEPAGHFRNVVDGGRRDMGLFEWPFVHDSLIVTRIGSMEIYSRFNPGKTMGS